MLDLRPLVAQLRLVTEGLALMSEQTELFAEAEGTRRAQNVQPERKVRK